MTNYPSDNPVWTTNDEILYLRGLAQRDGRRMGAHRGGCVPAKQILESWLTTYKRREWDINVDVTKCLLVAQQMIEEMEG